MTYLAISIGAVLGANLRFLIGGWVYDRAGTSFPWATLLINVSGSFALGLVLALVSERIVAPAWVKPGLAIGFLGSYTTFSTFSYETLALAREGSWLAAGGNIIGSVAAALVGVYLGTVVARAV
jgi:CrcB protein